jgi:hypothetical protein
MITPLMVTPETWYFDMANQKLKALAYRSRASLDSNACAELSLWWILPPLNAIWLAVKDGLQLAGLLVRGRGGGYGRISRRRLELLLDGKYRRGPRGMPASSGSYYLVLR